MSDLEDKKEKVYSTHTKFCTFGKNCKKKFKCVFAHNFKELCPIMCKYDKDCLRKEKCYYMHNYETKVQYVKRAFPEELIKFNIKLVDTPYAPSKKEETDEDKKFEDKEDEIIEIDIETQNENRKIYKEQLEKLKKMFYDPALDFMCWGDVNEFVDLDCYEEDRGKKVLYVL
jgi:hypothetical protein